MHGRPGWVAHGLAPVRTTLALLLLLAIPVAGVAYEDGTFPGWANDPPNMFSCTSCHGGDLTEDPGTFSISELAGYVPGQTYDFSVTMDPNVGAAGFQLTVLDAFEDFAGELIITDATNTQYADFLGDIDEEYVTHTLAGTQPGQDDAAWTFAWTAPDELTGPVKFYVTGVQGSGDGSSLGDDTYQASVTVPELEAEPVVFDVEAQTGTIDDQGGLLSYDVSLQANLPQPMPGMAYWTTAVVPGSGAVGPIEQIFFALPAQFSHQSTREVLVPAGAPAGTYVYSAHLGFYPTAMFTESFTFTKADGGAATLALRPDGGLTDRGDWPFAGETSRSASADAATALPAEFSLTTVYPNPFNNQATVTVAVPEATELTVELLNIQGQTVRTLVAGAHSAGTHNFALDGADLAAGVYLVRARSAQGDLAVRKATLLK